LTRGVKCSEAPTRNAGWKAKHASQNCLSERV